MKLVNIGFGNMLNADRIIAVLNPDSAPVKRIISEGKDRSILIDATQGRRTKSVIVTDTDHVILSYLSNEAIANRMKGDTVMYEEDDNGL